MQVMDIDMMFVFVVVLSEQLVGIVLVDSVMFVDFDLLV